MSQYSHLHSYGVTRAEYYRLTGITPEELLRHLEAEIKMLELNNARLRKIFRKEEYGTRKSRYLQGLIKHNDGKIARKQEKALLIQRRDLKSRECI